MTRLPAARTVRSALTSRTLAGNAVANLAGRLVPGLLTLASVPILLHLLGIEAYGVIGLYATLQIVLATLELGLTTTAAREVARNAANRPGDDANRNLLRTLEFVYGAAGVVIVLLFALFAYTILGEVVHPHRLSSSALRAAMLAAGLAIGGRWPVSLYRGTLDGLNLQVKENAITLAVALVRIGGGLLFVAFVVRTITGFMAWQAGATVAELVAMRIATWGAIGRGGLRPHFDVAILRRLWRFAASLTAVGLFGAILSQADKVIVSAKLPLKDLGYYTLAYTATGPLAQVAASIATAALPRFAGHLAGGGLDQLTATYHRTIHVLAFGAIWGSLPLVFFAREILLVWTGSHTVADAAATPVRLLAVAALFNAIYTVPYTLALADGRSRIALTVNVVSAPILVVVTYVVVVADGIVGAAAVWLVEMGSFLLIYSRWVHKVLLPGEFRSFVRDMLPYAALGVALFTAARVAASSADELAVSVALLLLALGLYTALGIRVLPAAVREVLTGWLARPTVATARGVSGPENPPPAA